MSCGRSQPAPGVPLPRGRRGMRWGTAEGERRPEGARLSAAAWARGVAPRSLLSSPPRTPSVTLGCSGRCSGPDASALFPPAPGRGCKQRPLGKLRREREAERRAPRCSPAPQRRGVAGSAARPAARCRGAARRPGELAGPGGKRRDRPCPQWGAPAPQTPSLGRPAGLPRRGAPARLQGGTTGGELRVLAQASLAPGPGWGQDPARGAGGEGAGAAALPPPPGAGRSCPPASVSP